MRTARWLSVAFLLLACAGGAALGWQRLVSAQVQGEIDLLRDENRELVRLRDENRRLAAALPSVETLATWRVDHGAVRGLRDEIERLRADVQARESALAK